MIDKEDAADRPLWARLRDDVRARILAREWTAGELVPSEAQLCDRYGVSRITATRALNELVREGMVVRQRGRGTTVAPAAPSASRKGPRTLGFVTSRLDFSWSLDVYSGFERAAAAAHHVSLLASTHGQLTLEAERLRAVLAAQPQALALQVRPTAESLALLGYDIDRNESAERTGRATGRGSRGAVRTHPGAGGATSRGVPFAFVGTYDPDLETDRVTADNFEAGLLATRHLLGLGHQRIGFVGPSAAWLVRNTSYRDRLAGYSAAMREQSLSADAQAENDSERLILADGLPEDLTDEARRDQLLAFLDRTGATALVTATDTLAVFLIRYLAPAGIRVPEHLAMAGIGDERAAALVETPLTTVHISPDALGESVARLLLRRLAGDTSPPLRIVVPVSLVVRASCGSRVWDAQRATSGAHAADEAALRSLLA